MIGISENERQRAFSIWLRTGRLPSVRNADGIELKYNPWHDPENGRFTFAGAGRNSGQWGGGGFPGGGGGTGGSGGTGGDWSARSSQPQNPTGRTAPKASTQAAASRDRAAFPKAPTRKSSAQGTWTGGGFTGGGGGRFGGGGAQSNEPWGEEPKKQRSGQKPAAIATTSRTPVSAAIPQRRSVVPAPLRREVRNGYEYQIDAEGRTRRVSGALTVADKQVRSRAAQAKAGGSERRPTDDGGHYIAVRFRGPRGAFNHFAQDANFNRGGYRVLEDEWAREKRAGKTVTVKIVPRFDGASARPSVIDVWWTVDGNGKSQKFPNERSERSHGGR